MDDIEKRRRDRLELPLHRGDVVPGLFNYDLRRTEQCIIPYATQEGELPSARTTPASVGVLHREDAQDGATPHQVVRRAREHEIFAGGKRVPLNVETTLGVREDIVTMEIEHDLNDSGSPRPRAKRRSGRATKLKQHAENARTAKLYREHVLQEKPLLDWSASNPWRRHRSPWRRKWKCRKKWAASAIKLS